jgi:hypothetical protein
VREAEILLARLDEFAAELARFRNELLALIPPAVTNGAGAEDAVEEDALIDTTSAGARFTLARDTIAKMCREVDGIGVWKGGRWQVRVAALRRYLDRKNNQ